MLPAIDATITYCLLRMAVGLFTIELLESDPAKARVDMKTRG